MTVQEQIVAAANAAGVPAQLALNIAQRESGFDQSAIGAAGEIGIFQLMPSTAAGLGVDPHDAAQNIAGGVAYLTQLLHEFGNVQQAVAAYNCGPGCVANAVSAFDPTDTVTSNGVTIPAWLAAVPASTQAYVAAVTGSLAASPDVPVPGGVTSGTPTIYAAGGMLSSNPGDSSSWLWGGAAVLAFFVLRSIGNS